MVYLDSSALVKLVIAERESAALQQYLRVHPQRASSSLVRTEVARAVRPHGAPALARTRRLFARLDLVPLDDDLLDEAGALDAGVLRSLDAIHLAAARRLDDELTAIVTYDTRMIAAAKSLGLPVATPRPASPRTMKEPAPHPSSD